MTGKVFRVSGEEWISLLETKRSLAWMKEEDRRLGKSRFKRAIDWETGNFKKVLRGIVSQ